MTNEILNALQRLERIEALLSDIHRHSAMEHGLPPHGVQTFNPRRLPVVDYLEAAGPQVRTVPFNIGLGKPITWAQFSNYGAHPVMLTFAYQNPPSGSIRETKRYVLRAGSELQMRNHFDIVTFEFGASGGAVQWICQ